MAMEKGELGREEEEEKEEEVVALFLFTPLTRGGNTHVARLFKKICKFALSEVNAHVEAELLLGTEAATSWAGEQQSVPSSRTAREQNLVNWALPLLREKKLLNIKVVPE
ncbi:hypothetical protein U1Q18_031424, partial [Sarracenia purpurea var. burkii]